MSRSVRRRAWFGPASVSSCALCAGMMAGLAMSMAGCQTWSRPAAELSSFRERLNESSTPISASMLSPTPPPGCGAERGGAGGGEFVVPQRIALARVQTTPGALSDEDDRRRTHGRVQQGGVTVASASAKLMLTVPTDEDQYDLLSRVKRETRVQRWEDGIETVSILSGTTQRFGHSADSIMAVARSMNADWLMLYTMDTQLTDETHGAIFSLFTLGLIPNHAVSHDATALAMVIDLRTSRVAAEWTLRDDGWQPANSFTAGDARKQVERRTERRIEHKLAEQLGALVRAVAAGKDPAGASSFPSARSSTNDRGGMGN